MGQNFKDEKKCILFCAAHSLLSQKVPNKIIIIPEKEHPFEIEEGKLLTVAPLLLLLLLQNLKSRLLPIIKFGFEKKTNKKTTHHNTYLRRESEREKKHDMKKKILLFFFFSVPLSPPCPRPRYYIYLFSKYVRE